MDPSAALRAGPELLRRRAAAVLPYYLLAASAPAIARVPALVCAAVAVAYLASTGRLAPLFDGLDTVAGEGESGTGLGPGLEPQPAPSTGPSSLPDAGGGALPPALVDALRGLVTPTTVALVLVGLLASLLVFAFARGATAAGTLAAVDAGLRGENPLPAGAAGIRRHWPAFVAFAVLRAGAYLSAGVLMLAVAAVVPLAAALLVLPLLACLVGVELVLGFAGPAVVVDGVGPVGALRGALGLATRRPAAYLVLFVVGAAAFVGMAGVGFTLSVAGVPRVAGLLSVLVVFPAIDGFRVALYAGRDPAVRPTGGSPSDGGRDDAGERREDTIERPRDEPIERPRDETIEGPRDDAPDGGGSDTTPTALAGGVGRTLRDGVAALARFLRDHPGANLAGGALLVVGALLGWRLVAPYGVTLPPPGDPGMAFGAMPVGPFLNIAANNWLVAAGASYGGLAVGLPSAAALLFNGALVGALLGVFDATAFVGLVAPHGVVELPAIAVAGGLGLHLGRIGWEALRGRRSAAAVGEELGEALRVLVGLAVLFVVAAAIEAFVTPLVGAAVLG